MNGINNVKGPTFKEYGAFYAKDDRNQDGKIAPSECRTCKSRKYVDGSNEGDVSFKAPGHISPGESVGKVMSHEQEHVANARAAGSKPGNELVSVSVNIRMETCPECGRAYAAGGSTTTVMKKSVPNYHNTPYDKAQKLVDGEMLAGAKVDATV